jgi:hypothetical protein
VTSCLEERVELLEVLGIGDENGELGQWSPAPWRNLLPEIHDKMNIRINNKVVFTWSTG